MADDEIKSTVKDFVVSVGPTVVETEEQALAVYYQMRSYPELRALLDQHQKEISRAIQQKDPQTLINIIQKVQSDFLRGLSEKAYQVQVDTERKMKEAQASPDEIAYRVNSTEQALSETLGTAEAMREANKKKNQKWIEKIVENYTREPQSLTDAIVANAETYANLSPEEIIQNAAMTIRGVSPDAVNKLLRDHEFVERVTDLQKNTVTAIEQQVIEAVLDSPEPTTTINAMNRYVEKSETKPVEIDDLIEKAKLVSTASSIVRQVPEHSVPDYEGFFTSLAQTGNPIEKAFAPLADALLTIFPSDTKETIVTSVMSSLWKKDTRAGSAAQGALGGLFQSEMVTKAIKQGNAIFSTTSKGSIITPVQSFFGDVITTVFHPTVADVWIEMVRTETGLPASLYQHYLSLLARRGSQEAAKALATKLGKKAAQEAGKVAAKKITVKAVGQTIGAALGSLLMAIGIPPGIAQAIGAWLAGKVFEKIGGFFGKAVGLIKGLANYIAEPWFKDYGTVIGLALIAILIVPAMIPALGTFFPFLPGASYYEKNTSTAYVQGMTLSDVGESGSKFISIQKNPSQVKFENNSGATVVYSISISATQVDLSNVRIDDVFSGFSKNGPLSIPQPSAITIPSISVSQPFTTTVSLPIGGAYNDSVIINALTVVADAGSSLGETKTTSASIIIGSPPTGCFAAKDSGPMDTCGSGSPPSAWDTNKWGTVVGALAQLSRSAAYIGRLCSSGSEEIPVYWVNTDFGGGCYSGGGIYLYQRGVLPGSVNYTVAHESGHALAARGANPNWFNQYHAEGIWRTEGPLPTYFRTTASEGEDFAEAIGLYVGHSFYYPSRWNSYPHYPESYPLHYNFVKNLFGGVEY